ncbi:MAG: hypothetical protein FWE35_17280 [Streptosporangiales bacterium]|nr:hypothetical protein [Streptosporangiales bacterium]
MSQPTFQPADYALPCPRCAAAVRVPHSPGPRHRTTCFECGFLLTLTWTDETILLASYPPVHTPPVPRQAGAPAGPRFEPRPRPVEDGRPDWEGARRRVTRAMNGLR